MDSAVLVAVEVVSVGEYEYPESCIGDGGSESIQKRSEWQAPSISCRICYIAAERGNAQRGTERTRCFSEAAAVL